MKNEQLIIKKIILNYLEKSASWDYSESIEQLKKYIKKNNNKKFLEHTLYEMVSYQKKCLRYNRWKEYYDTIWKNYYWWNL